MNIFKTYFFCLCCCLLASSFSTDLFANVNDCIEDDMACEEALVVSNRMNDSLALVALYNATDGANWTNTWDLNQPMDTWYGVTLDGNGSGRVFCLDLDGDPNCHSTGYPGNNLVGFIPSELGNLNNLVILSLSHNELSGSIPIELGNLTNLVSLSIVNAKLSGNIPAELGNLTNLITLTLHGSKGGELNGNIPVELGNLTNLTTLNLSWNKLTGSIPIELTQLTNLTTLNLYENQLIGDIPIELTNLTNLTILSIGFNQLTGEIPVELAQLTNLTELRLSGNELIGDIPVELAQLTNLNTLDLYSNQLTGSIPVELAQLTNLAELYLDSNQLLGSIPSELGQLSNLTTFSLGGNQLSGNIPPELGQLSNLTRLYLVDNQLSGNIPMELGQLISLRELYLFENQLSGNIPIELAQLSNLATIELSNNQLSGNIPVELGQLSNLWTLNLKNNQLHGNIPSELGQLLNLWELDLSNNQLSENIPSELGQLSNLNWLYLNNNQINGDVPAELGQLDNLTRVYLFNNQLSGCFPVELNTFCDLGFSDDIFSQGYNFTNNPNLPNNGDFTSFCNNETGMCDGTCAQRDSLALIALYNATNGSNWTNTWDLNQPMETWHGVILNTDRCVKELNLINNQLNGHIPSELAQLSNLTHLTLYDNQLNGSIPKELGQLSNLILLHLGNNQLSGSIPPEIGGLSSLSHLFLYENNLSGNIPSELGNLNFTSASELHLRNNNLSGCFPPELSQFCNIFEVSFDNNPNLPNNGDVNLFCNNQVGMCNGTCAQRDSLTLIALYNATNGANWTNTWDLTQPMETWQGVTLNEDRCVQSLTLSNNQLVGNIPTELGNLLNLQHLDLYNNELVGEIPNELSNAINLKELILDDNSLSGIIPTSLSTLTSLKTLALQRNQLTGTIPVEFGNLSNLKILALAYNQLTGTLPTELSNLSNLNWLILNDNQLDGILPSNFSQLTQLNYLILGNNQLSGFIPSELGNLTNLTWLSLSSNQFTGAIPAELGNLTNLTDISLHSNQLSGCFPPELLSLCDVPNRFFFNNPDLSGEGDFNAFCDSGIGICEEGCAYRDSLALVALYNATDGANWTTTWNLNQPMETWFGVTLDENRCVVCLDLDNFLDCDIFGLNGNNLIGTIPSELGNLEHLTSLSLSDNQLSGSIPSELGQLANLVSLSLNDNQLSGSIPPELGQLSNLEKLYLRDNQLNGSIPSELGQLVNLTSIQFGYNQLSGSIPPELGQLNELRWLSLYTNQLSGNIPPELGQLTNLKHFGLHRNQLSGNIPPELGQLFELETLSIYNNQLNGSIPSELGQLLKLKLLYLNANQLSGNIPSELGQLTNSLNELNLSNNQLTGDIPKELGQLINLVYIRLNNNQLDGCFPTELSTLCNIPNKDFNNNPDLPGGGDFDAFCNDGTGDCSISDVWPGDTNADCFVDYNDVLTLGRKHGKTGTIRPNATTDWIGQPATDWGDTAPDDIDAKHADCNGDGLVDNSDDAAVIQLNYGESCDNGQATILENFSGDAIIQSYWRNPSAAPNTIEVDLHLQSLSNTDIELYGIGFTVDFSTIGTNPIWSAANSDFGQAGQNLYTFAQDLGNGTIDIALTRTDGNTAILTPTNNYLGTLTFQVNNANSNNHLAKANNGELYLRFHNAKMVDGTGQELSAMLGGTATASFGEGEAFASPVSFFTHATYTQDCHDGGTATVVPGSGVAPFTYLWDTGSTSPQADNLEVGQHQVTVTDASNISLVGTIMILGDCATILLPLEWLNFTATAQTNHITLDWTTANEVGIDQFEIQRSTNGIDFNTIATQVATGQSNAYQFIDKQVYPKQTYYYRIKTNEANKSHFSLVRTARLVTTFQEIVALPNPVKEELTLYLDETNPEDIQVIIYNQMGQPIEQLAYTNNTLQTTLSIDFSIYPQGLYLVTIVQGQQQQALKIVKE